MADLRQVRNTDGWLIFAAVIMFIVGFHNLIYGIASLRDYIVIVDNLYSTSTGTGVIYANTTFWGWLWIVVGIVQMGIAFGIAAGNELSRWVGIVIAALNAIGQLAFMAAFPIWSVIIIAIDVLVIYALATYQTRGRGGAAEPYPSDRPGMTRGAPTTARSGVRAGAGGGYDRDQGYTSDQGYASQPGQTGRGEGYPAGPPDPGQRSGGPGLRPGDPGYRDPSRKDGPGGSGAGIR
ncbi:hypothetical protein BBK14_07155 [Parafrankia soli]|uniref:DUF7144 domain-containing protein n=1 Tax=Parafrankia soli TaxID=2599596 RepID=A0A1S1PRI4_9ACTN|nr:hypothetical protein [Parafrankia soli]OHV22544.1 hypothetical protein BBK14_07155 [Parafrankia soli]